MTLALGIGAATILFSVTNAILWRPLPFPNPNRLVDITEHSTAGWGRTGVSFPNFADWRERAGSFENLAASDWGVSRVFSGSGSAERLVVRSVSHEFFETLRVRPVLGRSFRKDEETGARVAILSNELWRRSFDGSPSALNQIVRLDGEPYTVVAILPAGFSLDITADPDVWVPVETSGNREARSLAVFGRMKPGVSIRQARAEMKAIAAHLEAEHPDTNRNWTIEIDGLRQAYTKFDSGRLFLQLGFGGFVLLIACANVASLLLVRFAGGQKETALRTALGANTVTLIRQALAENAWIAFPGGAAGAILAAWGTAAVQRFLPAEALLRPRPIEMDLRVFAFVLAVCLTATILFSIGPVLMGSRIGFDAALRDGGKSVAPSLGASRRIDLLIACELMLAFVLLFGAGLFVSSYSRLQQVPLGFDPHDVLSLRVLPGTVKPTAMDRLKFYRQTLEKVGAISGVRSAALADGIPFVGASRITLAGVPGRDRDSVARIVSPDYFRVMGISILRGRPFAEQDSASSPRVAIVNENVARRIFDGEDPVGKELEIRSGSAAPGKVQIVGLVSNTTEFSQNEISFDDVYLPFEQNPGQAMYVLAKTQSSADSLLPIVRREIRSVDAGEAVYNIATMEARLTESLRGARFYLALVSVFAILALLLAGVGVYGAIAFSVAQRTREFGLRVALGADPSSILRLALGRAARLTLIGSASGLAMALALGALLKSALYIAPGKHVGLIYGVGIRDPLSLGVAGIVLLIVAIAAAMAPANRAARMDPLTALRHE